VKSDFEELETFVCSSKRRRGCPSESHVKRGSVPVWFGSQISRTAGNADAPAVR
jgi:hypothetical protein